MAKLKQSVVPSYKFKANFFIITVLISLYQCLLSQNPVQILKFYLISHAWDQFQSNYQLLFCLLNPVLASLTILHSLDVQVNQIKKWCIGCTFCILFILRWTHSCSTINIEHGYKITLYDINLNMQTAIWFAFHCLDVNFIKTVQVICFKPISYIRVFGKHQWLMTRTSN